MQAIPVKKKSSSSLFKITISVLVTAILYFLIAFVLIPDVSVLVQTFYQDGELSFSAIEKIAKSDRVVESLKNSFLLAVTLPITTSLIGIVQVLLIDYFDIKGSRLLTLCYLIPLVFGGLLINNGYIFAYGPNGVFTNFLTLFNPEMNPYWFRGYGAVLIAMSFGMTTNYMLFFRNTLNSIDFHTVEAARNLGAPQWMILRKVVFPQLRPIIATIIVLLFQSGLGAMAAPLILGGENFETISPLILTLANRPSSRDIAAILALIQGFFQIIVLIIIQRNQRGKNYMSISKTKAKLEKQKIANPVTNVMAHLTAYLLALLNAVPFLSVILFSFTDYQTIASGRIDLSSFTVENYIRVITDPSAYSPFLTSVVYSFLAAAGVAVLAIFVGRLAHKHAGFMTGTIEALIHVPWLLPGILFALGLVVTYSVPQLWVGNRVLTGTMVIMLIAYVVVMMPNTYRFTRAAYFGVDENLEDAARNLGASQLYTFFRVVLPVIIPTGLALFALNFNGKLADYDLSAFLYHPLHPTLGIVIRNNADPSAAIDAKAINLVYSVILIIINILVVWTVYYDGLGQLGRLYNRMLPRKKNVIVTESEQSGV